MWRGETEKKIDGALYITQCVLHRHNGTYYTIYLHSYCTRYRMVGVDAGAFLSSPGAWMSRSVLFNAFADAFKQLIPGHRI